LTYWKHIIWFLQTGANKYKTNKDHTEVSETSTSLLSSSVSFNDTTTKGSGSCKNQCHWYQL